MAGSLRNRIGRRGRLALVGWGVLAAGIGAGALPAPPAAASGTPTLQITKTADADPVAGGFANEISWTILWSCASITDPCTSASITDSLPGGLTLSEYTSTGGSVASATPTGNSVTWSLVSPGQSSQLNAGSTGSLEITALAPCSLTDQVFTNSASFSASNAATVSTSPSSITITGASTCAAPSPPPPEKTGPAIANPGGRLPYQFTLPWDLDPSGYQVVDAMPAGLDFTSTTVEAPATVEVSCDGGSVYEPAFDFATNGTHGACTRTGGYWNVTHVRFDVPASTDPGWTGGRTSAEAWIYTDVPSAATTGTTYTNSVTIDGTPSSVVTTLDTPSPMPMTTKFRGASPGTVPDHWFPDATHPVADDTIGYVLTVGNNGNFGAAGEDLVNPIVTDLLDANLSYESDDWWRIGDYRFENELVGSGCGTPAFAEVPNWQSSGRTLLRWTFTNCTIPKGGNLPRIDIFFTATLAPGRAAGTSIVNRAYTSPGGSIVAQVDPDLCTAPPTDSDDVDADGNTTEVVCDLGWDDTYVVPKLATIESSKWVNGAADPVGSYSRYPAVGDTTPDAVGAGTYQIYLEMVGNIDSDEIELVDVLPHVGDTAVLNPAIDRLSDWDQELAGPIEVAYLPRAGATSGLPAEDQPDNAWQALDPGVDYQASYSASTNPCRLTASSFGQLKLAAVSHPTGCTSSPWGLGTSIGARAWAVRLTRNLSRWTSATDHGDMLRITVRVVDINDPVPPADLGGVAWNSFAYTVTDTTALEFLSSEPLKVGLTMAAQPATTASLGDVVWTDTNRNCIQDEPGSAGVDGVTVHLFDGNGTLVGATVTGPDPADPTRHGFYKFNGLVPTATYRVVLGNPADLSGGPLTGYELAPRDCGPDDTLDSDAQDVIGVPTIVSAPTGGAGSMTPTYDFGFQALPASLGDYVWLDADHDGVQDEPSTNGVNGITVELLNGDGAVVTTDIDGAPIVPQVTADDGLGDPGYYRFDNLAPGFYKVRFSDLPPGYAASPVDQGGDDALDSDGVVTATIALVGGTHDPTLDFGFWEAVAVGNYVWIDTNYDGIQNEPAANGVNGVMVTLLDGDGLAVTADQDGNPITSVLTAADEFGNPGYYRFPNLPAGTYRVGFSNLPSGYLVTRSNVGDDALDSDSVLTGPTTLSGFQVDLTLDLGLFQPAALGDRAWLDSDFDGTQDEPAVNGMNGITVTLFDAAGTPVTVDAFGAPVLPQLTRNDASGNPGYYFFDDLLPGTYVVGFTTPAGYQPTTLNGAGSTAENGSDLDPATGRTATVTLGSGVTDPRWDAGYTVATASPPNSTTPGNTSNNSLATTGGSPLGLLQTAFGLLSVGEVVRRRSRRNPATANTLAGDGAELHGDHDRG